MKKNTLGPCLSIGMVLCIGIALPLQLWSPPALAVQQESPITAIHWQTLTREAIAKFEQTALQEWAFCLASAENEEGQISSSTECFDPTLPPAEQWQLRLSNGQTPTAQQQHRYLANKQKHSEQGKAFNLTLKLSRVILLDSVQFVSEDATNWYGSFAVYIDKLGTAASKQLQGQLRFNKAGNFIDRIEISNTGPFSVMLGSKVQRFQLKLDFIQLEHAILQRQQEMILQGSFAFVSSIDEISSDVFSDFRYIGPATQAGAVSGLE